MSLGQAVSICFTKYVTFSGRAARPEYWYWVLFTIVASLVLAIGGTDWAESLIEVSRQSGPYPAVVTVVRGVCCRSGTVGI